MLKGLVQLWSKYDIFVTCVWVIVMDHMVWHRDKGKPMLRRESNTLIWRSTKPSTVRKGIWHYHSWYGFAPTLSKYCKSIKAWEFGNGNAIFEIFKKKSYGIEVLLDGV